jgi:hypothetical protein
MSHEGFDAKAALAHLLRMYDESILTDTSINVMGVTFLTHRVRFTVGYCVRMGEARADSECLSAGDSYTESVSEILHNEDPGRRSRAGSRWLYHTN